MKVGLYCSLKISSFFLLKSGLNAYSVVTGHLTKYRTYMFMKYYEGQFEPLFLLVTSGLNAYSVVTRPAIIKSHLRDLLLEILRDILCLLSSLSASPHPSMNARRVVP
jgi:hypothetical protein